MKPTNGVAVTGATCEQSNGKTIMTFTRNAAASGNTENAIATGVGTKTSFIWAYGSSNTLAYHSQRGVIEYDVTANSAEVTKEKASAVFYAHMVCMALAWGMLLPWGVSVASRSRKVDGAAPGAWFRTHEALQYTGWLLQIVGFIMAILYVGEKGGMHFNVDVPHTI